MYETERSAALSSSIPSLPSALRCCNKLHVQRRHSGSPRVAAPITSVDNFKQDSLEKTAWRRMWQRSINLAVSVSLDLDDMQTTPVYERCTHERRSLNDPVRTQDPRRDRHGGSARVTGRS